MKKLFIASNNPDKIIEIRDILRRNNVEIELLCPKDFNINTEPDENGSTFKENAYIKAKYYYDLVNIPTIADDSGICLDFLDGGPGIHSARYLPGLTYDQKNDYILEMMKDSDNRGAKFVDVLCFIDADGKVSYYEGENAGFIAYEKKGDKGFGYDPIFLIPAFNKTEAELGSDYKDEFSHRAKALKKWIVDAKEKF